VYGIECGQYNRGPPREKPESAQVLFRFGMGCLGCAIANSETIREAAQVHGVPLEEMLSALGIAEA